MRNGEKKRKSVKCNNIQNGCHGSKSFERSNIEHIHFVDPATSQNITHTDLDEGELLGVLAVVLDGRPEGVLEDLEEDVVEVGGHVGELDDVLGLLPLAVQVEHAQLEGGRDHVVLLAEERRRLEGP